jgi:hypothetical protein
MGLAPGAHVADLSSTATSAGGESTAAFEPNRFLPNPHDLWQKPSWRWARAGYLVDHHRNPRSQDDQLTRDAWLFHRRLERCRSEADRQQLALDFPVISDAYQIWTGPALRRAVIEARLLGDEPDVVIANKCGLTPDAVAVYHDVFFEVRPHLHADIYILANAIGDKVCREIEQDDHEIILKLFGYGGGGRAVDDYLEYLRDPPTVPESFDDLDLAALKNLRVKLRIKTAVLLLCTSASDLRPSQWISLREQLSSFRPVGEDAAEFESAVTPALDAVACLTDGATHGEAHRTQKPMMIPA